MEALFQKVVNQQTPKILAIGKNYVKHVKEMGGQDVPKEPVVFMKPFSSIVYPSEYQANYQLPEHNREIHHQVELGFMIGQAGKNIQSQNWNEYVGGYFLGLDLTDRDLQSHFQKQGFPWDLAQGADGLFPISQFVEQSDVSDPHNLDLNFKINDKLIQNDNTQNMYYQIPFLIEFLSQYMTLVPGDLVLTGTPSGVGPIISGDQVYASLKNKDKVLAEIQFTAQK